MSKTRDVRGARREAIRELLGREDLRSQRELAARLGAAGIDVTQSSLSRDLRDLGAFKVRGVYRLSARGSGTADLTSDGASPEVSRSAAGRLAERFRLVREIVPAGDHLIVIKTDEGAAQGVAVGIDGVGIPGVLGTVAGDDTIFVATASATSRRVRKRLEDLRRESE